MRFTNEQLAAMKARDNAMIAVLGDCPGNVAELMMVLEEAASYGDTDAAAELDKWAAALVEAEAAGEAALKATGVAL